MNFNEVSYLLDCTKKDNKFPISISGDGSAILSPHIIELINKTDPNQLNWALYVVTVTLRYLRKHFYAIGFACHMRRFARSRRAAFRIQRIYRTYVRRRNALLSGHVLYWRVMEEQSAGSVTNRRASDDSVLSPRRNSSGLGSDTARGRARTLFSPDSKSKYRAGSVDSPAPGSGRPPLPHPHRGSVSSVLSGGSSGTPTSAATPGGGAVAAGSESQPQEAGMGPDEKAMIWELFTGRRLPDRTKYAIVACRYRELQLQYIGCRRAKPRTFDTFQPHPMTIPKIDFLSVLRSTKPKWLALISADHLTEVQAHPQLKQLVCVVDGFLRSMQKQGTLQADVLANTPRKPKLVFRRRPSDEVVKKLSARYRALDRSSQSDISGNLAAGPAPEMTISMSPRSPRYDTPVSPKSPTSISNSRQSSTMLSPGLPPRPERTPSLPLPVTQTDSMVVDSSDYPTSPSGPIALKSALSSGRSGSVTSGGGAADPASGGSPMMRKVLRLSLPGLVDDPSQPQSQAPPQVPSPMNVKGKPMSGGVALNLHRNSLTKEGHPAGKEPASPKGTQSGRSAPTTVTSLAQELTKDGSPPRSGRTAVLSPSNIKPEPHSSKHAPDSHPALPPHPHHLTAAQQRSALSADGLGKKATDSPNLRASRSPGASSNGSEIVSPRAVLSPLHLTGGGEDFHDSSSRPTVPPGVGVGVFVKSSGTTPRNSSKLNSGRHTTRTLSPLKLPHPNTTSSLSSSSSSFPSEPPPQIVSPSNRTAVLSPGGVRGVPRTTPGNISDRTSIRSPP